jgi:hypothetical protein
MEPASHLSRMKRSIELQRLVGKRALYYIAVPYMLRSNRMQIQQEILF